MTYNLYPQRGKNEYEKQVTKFVQMLRRSTKVFVF